MLASQVPEKFIHGLQQGLGISFNAINRILLFGSQRLRITFQQAAHADDYIQRGMQIVTRGIDEIRGRFVIPENFVFDLHSIVGNLNP